MRVRVEQVRVSANVPAGMNVLVLMSLTYMLRGTTEDPQPVQVRRDGTDQSGQPLYTIIDGRHRYMAAVVAGRHDVLVEVAG